MHAHDSDRREQLLAIVGLARLNLADDSHAACHAAEGGKTLAVCGAGLRCSFSLLV